MTASTIDAGNYFGSGETPKRRGYLGSKLASGAYQAIIATFPPHDTFIDAFCGGGGIINNKTPAEYSIAIDIHGEAGDCITAPGVLFLNTCGLDYLERVLPPDLERLGRVLVYCDPPYLPATRSSSKRYQHEFTVADHRRLLDLAQTLAAMGAYIAISGYPSDLYDNALPAWRTIEFQAMTRGGPRTEKLWMSYPPCAVDNAAYAGANFTDRQRIKRKAARWARMYAAMPPAERLAVLATMLEHSHGQLGGTDE